MWEIIKELSGSKHKRWLCRCTECGHEAVKHFNTLTRLHKCAADVYGVGNVVSSWRLLKPTIATHGQGYMVSCVVCGRVTSRRLKLLAQPCACTLTVKGRRDYPRVLREIPPNQIIDIQWDTKLKREI